MPKASEVAAELRRTYESNQSRIDAVNRLNKSPLLVPVYVEVLNILQENNLALKLAIGALESHPRSAKFSIFDCNTREQVSDKTYNTVEEANRDYHMNAGHTFIGQAEEAPIGGAA